MVAQLPRKAKKRNDYFQTKLGEKEKHKSKTLLRTQEGLP